MNKNHLCEGQLQIDFETPTNQGDNFVETPAENHVTEGKNNKFVDILSKHHVTEDEIDKYVDQRGCSYDDALMHFGVSRKERDDFYTNTDEAVAEKTEPETKCVSIDLADRAIKLLGSLDEYSRSSRANGFDRALDTPHADRIINRYDGNGIANIIHSQVTHKDRGDDLFRKAYGFDELVEAGYDRSDVYRMMQTDRYNFIESNTGPANVKSRKFLRNALTKQIHDESIITKK